MNDSQTVTNEMLNGKLDLVLKILEQHDKRFEQQDARMDRMERKVDDIYEVRDRVTVGFSRAFAGVNILLSALVAFFVSMWR
jgi:hypothetical protein